MHIHLINHQVVNAYSLKSLPEMDNCTLYTLDYLRLTNLTEFQNKSDVELCTFYLNMR